MKKYGIIALLLALLLAFTGCSQVLKGKITAGTWDGMTFTNTWSDIKFTLPDDFTILTPDEIAEVNSTGKETMVNNGSNSAEFDIASMKSMYDCMFYLEDGMSNISIMYENLDFGNQKNVTEADYAKAINDQLAAVTTIKFEPLDSSKRTIAGHEFYANNLLVNDFVNQTYYLYKFDNAMMCIITTYIGDSEESMNKFLDSITSAK